MKLLLSLLTLSFLFYSCSKSGSGKKLAEEICECYKQALDLPEADTSRTEVQKDCMKKMLDANKQVQNNKKELEEFNETLKQCNVERLTNTPVKENTEVSVLTDETKVNELLNSQAGNNWRVVKDQETTWEGQKDIDYYLMEGRKKDPNHPFIVTGDFDGDNKMDYAALVTNGTREDNRQKTKIAILHGNGSIEIMDEYSTTNTALELVTKMTRIDAFDEDGEEKSVMVKYDAFLVNNHDTGGYYIYWDGKKYEKIWLEG